MNLYSHSDFVVFFKLDSLERLLISLSIVGFYSFLIILRELATAVMILSVVRTPEIRMPEIHIVESSMRCGFRARGSVKRLECNFIRVIRP